MYTMTWYFHYGVKSIIPYRKTRIELGYYTNFFKLLLTFQCLMKWFDRKVINEVCFINNDFVIGVRFLVSYFFRCKTTAAHTDRSKEFRPIISTICKFYIFRISAMNPIFTWTIPQKIEFIIYNNIKTNSIFVTYLLILCEITPLHFKYIGFTKY